MKNIIKRGTSLLLVLAMLLSFAAVVGATDATTTTPEKILTLTVENKLLRAGQTEYLAVYEQVAGDYKINALTISATSTNSKVAVKGIYPWIPKSYSGGAWDYDYDTRETVFSSRSVGGDPIAAPPTADPLLVWTSASGFQTSTKPLCFIKVEAQADVTPGAYQINICRNPHPEKEDDYFLFAYADPVTTEGVSQTEENATLNPGTAVVIPASAELPTVILTKTAFEAPTMATYDPEQSINLLNYLKIVDKDGNLHDASSAADTSITGNYVSNGALKLMPTSGNSGKILVNNLHAADDENITASATLTYTVTKDTVRTPWKAGFSTYNGKYKTQADFDADFAKNPPKAPVYNGGAEHNSTSVYPNVFDQYGEVMDGYSFVPLVTLYNAADHTTPLANKAGNADPAYSAVHFNYNPTTGKWASDTLYYTKELKKDVWCKIELGVIGPDGEKANIQADTLEFLIQSQYPQAASATLELRDKNDKEFPSGPMTTIAIPWGEIPTNTYTVHVSDFRQANGEGMPTGTEPSAEEVIIALDGTYTGVSISNGNKLVIDKTAQAGTVTVKATLNGKELGKLTLTLQKAASKATDAWVYDRENKTANTNSKVLPTLSGVENGKAMLPGIREGDKLVLTFGPGCVVDQYGEIYQVEGKDFLRPSQYALYKQSSTNPETYELCAEAERSVNAEGVVTATIKNSLDSDGNLRVQPGTYKFGTYNDNFFNGTTRFDLNQLLMSEPFELVEGEAELSGTPIYYGVEAGNEPTLYVPYKYGTLDSEKTNTMNVGAAITTQYGRPYGSSETPAYALNNVKLNEETIENKAITWTAEADGTGVTFTVDKSAAQLFGTSNTATLTAEMTVTIGTKSTPSIPISITIKKEASVLSAVKVEMAEDTAFTTGLRTWSANRTSESKEGEVTLLSPNAKKTWYIRRTAEDQYGVEMDIQSLVTATGCSWSYDTDKATGKILYFKLGVPAGFEESFVMQFTNFTKEYKFTAKFVPMQFVKSETGKNDTFQLSDYLNRTANEDGTFSAEYNGQLWSTILTKKDGAKVYIKTAEGENNTEIPADKLTLEVTKDRTPVGMDAKANAGEYKVKLVYTDNNQTYTVDEKTFTITPKTVKITANGTITKEYNGSPALPAGVTNDSFTKTGAYETVVIDPSALQYASENAGTDIQIELVPGKTTCLTGAAAANYNVSLDGLTGTIKKRMVLVVPNENTFTYGEDEQIENALKNSYNPSAETGTLPTDAAKRPKFTDDSVLVLTKNGAAVSKNSDGSYDAGTYQISIEKLKLTDASAQNYEFKLKTTTEKPSYTWTISKKSVDPFNVTLEADYGVYGSELYAMLNTAKVTVDGQQVNFNTLYNVEALYIKDAGKNNVSKTDALVNAGEYTVTSLPSTTIGTANYTFKTAPTLKIKVKPHVLTDADVQLSGETSAGFDGTKKTVTVTVSFTYNGRPVTLTKDTDYTITGEVEASNAGGHFVTVTAVPNGNLSGSVQKRWQIWSYEIQPGDLTFKLKSGVTFTYDTTPKKLQKSDVTWDVTATNAERKAFLEKNFTEDDFNLDCLERTDAGDYTASASLRHNFTKSQTSGAFNMNVSWTIGKSSEKPISNQTSGTKYGGSGSLAVTLSEGQYKGLANGEWTVNIVDSTIIKEAKVEHKDGKVTINWTLTDASKAGDTGSFKVTVPASTNYEGYEFTVTVNVTAKNAQTGFGFTYANPIVGYAEDTYTNPVQHVATTKPVAYTSSKPAVATVDSNGVVTILDVGETTITATAPEDAEYASATARYTLTVVPSTLTVTASSATMTANDPVPSFTASVTGFKRGQTAATVFQTLTASAATDGKTAGTYAVNASATLKTDFVPRYTLRFVPGTLTVNPAQTAIDTVLPIIIGGNTCANGYANCACESFYDLDASRWYHEAIDWAYSLGLMNGTTKSTFGPNAAATRAQTWTMLARIAGQDTRRSSTWYEVGQKWAMNLGITDGTNPMGSLTREQLAAMLYRYVGSPAVNGTLTFTDSANVSTWARNAMIWAVQNGILDGVGGNRLNPKGTTTRAQAAAIFMRFSKLINK